MALPCPRLHAPWQDGHLISILSIPCSLALSPCPRLVSRTDHRPCHLSGLHESLPRCSYGGGRPTSMSSPITASPARHSTCTVAQLPLTSHRPSHTFSNVSSRGKGKEIVCKYLYLYPVELPLTFYYMFLTMYHSILQFLHHLIWGLGWGMVSSVGQSWLPWTHFID